MNTQKHKPHLAMPSEGLWSNEAVDSSPNPRQIARLGDREELHKICRQSQGEARLRGTAFTNARGSPDNKVQT